MPKTSATPTYTVYITSGVVKYDVTPVLISLEMSADMKKMAQSATIQLINIKAGPDYLTSIVKARDRVYIYADDGNGKSEVFRGYVWTRVYKSSVNDREISYKCYDQLIYLQESEDSVFFASGKSTKDVCADLCSRWGIKMEYSYESITHSKLALRGNLSDIFTSDVLDLAKDRSGKKYVILSDKDTMYIKPWGSNKEIYRFLESSNVVRESSGFTMDGMITKVVIVGKSDDEGREPVEATVSKDTDKYGTLQKIISRDSNTSLADAKKEAQEIIDENGKPKWEYEICAVDIPWIRLGDKVYVAAGDIHNRYLIVTAISRTIEAEKSEMIITMEDP